MVTRTVLALDSAALLVDPTSPSGKKFQDPGESIINNGNSPNGTIYRFQSGFERQAVTLDDTAKNPDVFEDSQSGGHKIIDGKGLVASGQGVESESIISLKELDDAGNQVGPTIRLAVFSQGGKAGDIWGFATNDFLQPGARYVKTSGNNNGASDYDLLVPCFTAGTMIRTPQGDRAVETLKPGDAVWTQRDPALPLAWVGTARVEAADTLAPIRFEAGVLGNTAPLVV